MNTRELAAELARKGLRFTAIANMIGISKTAFYRKMNGQSQFKLREIKSLKEILSLSPDRISEIFFAE